jgi:hypothetical protein
MSAQPGKAVERVVGIANKSIGWIAVVASG